MCVSESESVPPHLSPVLSQGQGWHVSGGTCPTDRRLSRDRPSHHGESLRELRETATDLLVRHDELEGIHKTRLLEASEFDTQRVEYV